MFSNVIRAKLTTHGLMIALAVIVFMTNHFFSDPAAAAWVAGHWALRDLGQTIEATLLAWGVYNVPTRPMIP